MAYPSSMVMSRYSIEKCRSWTRFLRASYRRRASKRTVSGGSMLSRLEPRVQIVVLESAGLAELVELERQREPRLREPLREVGLHDVEQPGAGRISRGIAASGADFQYGVDESGVAQRAVGDAELLARDGAYANAAGRKHRLSLDAELRHELRELAAELAEAALIAQIRAVFQSHVRHVLMSMVPTVQPTAKIGIGR